MDREWQAALLAAGNKELCMNLRITLVLALAGLLASAGLASAQAAIDYPGDRLPGQAPERFAPGVAWQATASWWWMSAPAFSPAGTELFFCKYFPNGPHEVWTSSLEKGAWKNPVKAWFSETEFTASPCFSPDGKHLYFYAEGRPGASIFRMRRQGSGWSAPEPCVIPLPAGKALGQAFHVAANGNVYVTVLNGPQAWNSAKLCVSRLRNGSYSMPEELPGAINTESSSEMVSWVAPDEGYLFFASSRRGGRGEHDIYVSTRNSAGSWGAAVPVSILNTYQEDSWLSFSPDGAFAFFNSVDSGGRGYAAYWVAAKALAAFLP